MKNLVNKICIILIIVTICIFLGTCVTKVNAANIIADFTDIPQGAWYEYDVNYVVRHGLMNGTGNGKFSPDKEVTRAMMVTVLWRLEGKPLPEDKISFSDVDTNDYYATAVNWAVEKGIVNGVGNNQFAPNKSITREQAATMIGRYLRLYVNYTTNNTTKFDDDKNIAEYAKSDVYWLKTQNIINGDNNNNFNPKNGLKRAEFASLIRRVLSKKNYSLNVEWETHAFESSINEIFIRGKKGSILGFRKNSNNEWEITISKVNDIEFLYIGTNQKVKFFDENGKTVNVPQNGVTVLQGPGGSNYRSYMFFLNNKGELYLGQSVVWLPDTSEYTLIANNISKVKEYESMKGKIGQISFSKKESIVPEYKNLINHLFDIGVVAR